jgi:ABC-2 type transport system permease protein
LASLPSVALTTLVALNVINATLVLAVVAAGALLLLNRIGWRLVSATFDRERLIVGTK